MGVFFYVGAKINNAGVIIVSTVVMQLPIGILSYHLLQYRLSMILPLSRSITLNQDLFELSARKFLISGEMGEDLLKKLDKN